MAEQFSSSTERVVDDHMPSVLEVDVLPLKSEREHVKTDNVGRIWTRTQLWVNPLRSEFLSMLACLKLVSTQCID
jgi:hypothetical protein